MKKNIIFFADSSVDLINLYKVLKSKFNIIWIVYYEDVYEFLKKEGIEKVYLLNLSSKIFNKKNIITKLIKYFISLLGIKFGYTKLYRDLKDIEKQYSPVIFLTDSSMILANYKTESIKICTQHTVTFKKHFLHEDTLKYDYVFLPGEYHKERIKKVYKLNNIDKKFKVTGSIKISHFLRSNNFDRLEFMRNMNLDPNRINVLFAPSHDAHEKDLFGRNRFFPKKYGNQFNVLKKLIKELDLLNCNLIVKLHHYMHFYMKKIFFQKLCNTKNCFVFKSGQYHDVLESNDTIEVSDIILTDTSGVATIGAFLKKKLIFIKPHKPFDWHYSDIEKELRPGFVCDNLDEIVNATKNYVNNYDPFIEKKEIFVKKIFANPNKNANVKIEQTINELLNNHGQAN